MKALSSGGTSGGGTTGAGGTNAPTILFVAGSVSLSNDDTQISNRLKGLGYTVQVVDDSAVTAAMGSIAGGVLVSRTVSAGNIGTRLRDVTKGVMLCEATLFPNMGMTDPATSTSWGNTSNLTALDVQASAGALAAGLSGTVTVQMVTDQMNFGIPGPAGITVASQPGQTPAKWAIFAYESGAQMYGRAAAARRVGFYFSQTSATRTTPAGWALFDAAVRWTISR